FLAQDTPASERASSGEIGKLLIKYFSPSSKLERTWRAQRIYDGLIPNFDACWSLVDFRPVFDQARSQILNGIIVGSLSVQVRQAKAGGGLNSISFQLDVADIDELIGELNRMKSKIKLLRQMVEEKTQLLNPSLSLKESDEL